MSQLRITELDFAAIKNNLRAFLQSQSEFSDYNFEGSALSTLIDLLAYNTHYNAVLTHLMANEMFLDSAVKRSSVLSIAKTLGYVPRSKTGARITATVVVAGGPSPSLTLDTNSVFTGFLNNKAYQFYPLETYTAPLSGGVYTFTNVELIEGRRLSNTFNVTAESTSGPFILPVDSVDLNTLEVYVKDTANSSAFNVFNKVDTISGLTDESRVFWVEERGDGRYQISFGDGIFGRELTVGNVVIANYVAASGPEANGINQLFGTVVDGQSVQRVTVHGISAGGTDKETIDSIRKTAPIFNAAKNRVVTTQDYKALIQKNFDKAKAVTVWGGEENDPPIYGKVFITIDTTDNYVLTDSDKDFIIEKVLRPAAVMSIQHEFVDPAFLYVGVQASVTYDPRLTNFTATQIASSVRDAIQEYFDEELSTLERPFFPSKLNAVIADTSDAIIANLAKITLQLRISPSVGLSYSGTLNFLASIEPETIRSTIFNATINGVTYPVYIQDISNAEVRRNSTTGKLKLINANTDLSISNIGTVDYTSGEIKINNLMVSSYIAGGDIRITAEPTDLSKNISSTIIRTTAISPNAITPLPSRNVILTINDSDSNSAIQLTPGLTVTATPFIDS